MPVAGTNQTAFMNRAARAACIAPVVAVLCPPCIGQVAEPGDGGAGIAAHEQPFALSFGVDAVTAYQFRGFVYEESGPIVQPWLDLELLLARFDDAAVRLLFSTWHSFHGRATDAQTNDRFVEHWFEADINAGVAVDIDRCTLAARYNWYNSPSDAWPTMQEVTLELSYADDWLPEGWSLNPHVLLAFEIGPAANDGLRNGTFLEIGVGPAYEIADGPAQGFEIRFPLAIGLSLSNYYETEDGANDAFGYLSLGATVSVPLGSTGAANWSLDLGVQALLLGGAAASFNEGDRSVLIARVGVSVEF